MGNHKSKKDKGTKVKKDQKQDINTEEISERQIEEEQLRDEQIKEDGKTILNKGKQKHKIQLISIIGEIEGHDILGNTTKTTKYEHLLPQLAMVEDNEDIDGVLFLLNTMGGDVEAGLAIAEMIASLSKPTVSLVLGGSHSIGVPIATSTNYSFVVKTGTMVIHPVRLNGMVIGVTQTFDYFRQIQDRITGFIVEHSQIKEERLLELMMETKVLTKDVGSVLVGEQIVREGIVDEVGGMKEAIAKLHELISDNLEV